MFIRGNIHPGVAGTKIVLLQWGRGCSSAETTNSTTFEVDAGRRFNGAADVHPRKPTPGAGRWRHLLASMGPRMFIRGNAPRVRAPKAPESRKLQWGRGCSSAETSPPDRRARRWPRFNGAADVHPRKPSQMRTFHLRSPELQWGRGCSSAETHVFVNHHRRLSSFNGAADVHPRKRAT